MDKNLQNLYAKVCMAIVYHVSQGEDMSKVAQTATGFVIMNNPEGLQKMLEDLTKE